ncbi:GNAT family N-acetyltransferase [Winogradskya humida]|uniref:N-acetyltransferase n=1 Tax=Winogradskya humida TaxID=113566 RepID=A0ABQ3ZZH5_9ACTN|nr:GNAT family N-acetyltransferase [Actinoplanes humidus]GIE23996.1 N-acetyltransferase [Actinoplanes humidus]
MRLEMITPENYEAALDIAVAPGQEDLVAPVVKSLAEAYVFPDFAWPRLICDGDRVVGFVMAFIGIPWSDGGRRSGLWRLNIAADAQGTGGPEGFYLRLGFRATGEVSHGQTVGVLDL